MKNMKKKGFTIVELVIVIAVIAILAAVLIPTFANVIANANESNAMQAAKNAWTEAIADNRELLGQDIYITSGDYYFAVTDGEFSSEPVSAVPGVFVAGSYYTLNAETGAVETTKASA